MNAQKNIALVAHDNRKKDLMEWVEWNVHLLIKHNLTCTGTTGKLVEKAIRDKLAEEKAAAAASADATVTTETTETAAPAEPTVATAPDVQSMLPPDFKIRKLRSGPLGGDQQLGSLITEGNIDLIIFFWDPMEPQPHDVDVKALLRIAVLYNIPTACNRSTADFVISSPLMEHAYAPIVKDYDSYLHRELPIAKDGQVVSDTPANNV